MFQAIKRLLTTGTTDLVEPTATIKIETLTEQVLVKAKPNPKSKKEIIEEFLEEKEPVGVECTPGKVLSNIDNEDIPEALYGERRVDFNAGVNTSEWSDVKSKLDVILEPIITSQETITELPEPMPIEETKQESVELQRTHSGSVIETSQITSQDQLQEALSAVLEMSNRFVGPFSDRIYASVLAANNAINQK